MLINIELLVLVIIISSFTIIHFIEVIAFNARCAGVYSNKLALAFSLQNMTQTFTRFFYMLLLPLLGYLTDVNINPNLFQIMVHVSLLFAGIFSFFVYKNRGFFEIFYYRVLEGYSPNASLFSNFRNRTKNSFIKVDCSEYDYKLMFISCLVYTLYSVGVFSVFILSVNMPENRGMLSQLSGAINGFATLLLTVKLEPHLASYTLKETASDFLIKSKSVLLGRVIGVAFISQAFIFIWCGLI